MGSIARAGFSYVYRYCAVLAMVGAMQFLASAQAEVRAQPSSKGYSPSTANTPAVVRNLLRSGFRVIREFSAISKLTGWVLEDRDGQYGIFYATSDGRALFSGALLTGSGDNLTEHYKALYIPHADLRALWNELQSTAAVVRSGARQPSSVIYVIMDPNCVYCHMLWIALRPYETAGLQVRWIPVGILRRDSPGKAAALLEGGDPVLTQMQEGFNLRLESGGGACNSHHAEGQR